MFSSGLLRFYKHGNTLDVLGWTSFYLCLAPIFYPAAPYQSTLLVAPNPSNGKEGGFDNFHQIKGVILLIDFWEKNVNSFFRNSSPDLGNLGNLDMTNAKQPWWVFQGYVMTLRVANATLPPPVGRGHCQQFFGRSLGWPYGVSSWKGLGCSGSGEVEKHGGFHGV